MSFNKIYVLGAGAIGSVYGAFLSKNNDVTIIGNKAHVEAVNSRGLSISGAINGTFYPKAKSVIDDIPEKTLIILTTKAYDSVSAVKNIKNLLKSDTVILVLQNGLGNEELVKEAVEGKAKVLRGLTTMAAEFFEPGKVKFWNGETIVEANSTSKMIAETFVKCGLKVQVSDNIKFEVWKKLVVNCVVNPLTAIFQVRNFEILSDVLSQVRREIVEECVKVGKAEGINFPSNLYEKINEEIAGYTNFSSMCQDIMKGRKTEIEFLNGKIVELGKKHGVPTPINDVVFRFVKFLEEKHGIRK